MRKETENTWEREGLKVTQTVSRSKNISRSNQTCEAPRRNTLIKLQDFCTFRYYANFMFFCKQTSTIQGLLFESHSWDFSELTSLSTGYFKTQFFNAVRVKKKKFQQYICHKYLKLVSHTDEAKFSCFLFGVFVVICG